MNLRTRRRMVQNEKAACHYQLVTYQQKCIGRGGTINWTKFAELNPFDFCMEILQGTCLFKIIS